MSHPALSKTKEKENWSTAVWQAAKLPSAEDMAKSPVGAATLEMFRGDPPIGDSVQNLDVTIESNDSLESEPSQEDGSQSESLDSVPAESTNDIMAKQLSNWPPRSTPTPKAPVENDAPKRLWVAGRPTPESRGDLHPLPPEDFDNNKPIY